MQLRMNHNAESNLRKKIIRYAPLLILIIIGVSLRMLWFHAMIERDEGLFGIQGKLLLTQGPDSFSTNKPYLLTFTYGILIKLFGDSIFPVRIFNDVLFIISIMIFYHFISLAYDKKRAFLPTLFYTLLMNLPIFEGMLAMSESLSILPIILSFYFFYRYEQEQKTSFFFLSLISASVAFLLKSSNVFIILSIIALMALNKRLSKKHLLLMIIIYSLSIISADVLSLIFGKKSYFFMMLSSILQFYSQPISSYIPRGLLIFLLLESSFFTFLMLIGLIDLFVRRNEKISFRKEDNIFLSWLFFGLLICIIPPAFGHYFIIILPVIAFFGANGFLWIIETRNKILKIAFFIILLFLLSITIFFSSKQYPNYNINYKNFHFLYSDFSSYEEQMDVVNFIKAHTNSTDRILIYGWTGEIYLLSQREPFHLVRFVCYEGDPDLYSKIDHDKELAEWNPKLLIVMPQYTLECSNKTLFSSFIANSTLYRINNISIYEKSSS